MKTPRTLPQATDMAARYAALDAQRAGIEAERASRIAEINAACDIEAGPVAEEMDAIVLAMEPWWAKNSATLTKGKRKSAELGGCMIGSRAARARLSHGFESDDLAIEALTASKWRKATVVLKASIDRAATLKLLEGDGAVAEGLAALGFKVEVPPAMFYINRVEQSGTIGS